MAEEGATDTPEGGAATILGAAGTAVAEKVGINRLLKALPDGMTQSFWSKAADIMTAGGIEAVEEYMEGVLQDTAIKLLINPDKEIFPGDHRP